MKNNLNIFVFLILGVFYLPLSAAPVYISDFSDFPAYPYNTVSYKQNNAFVGCGPTTGAMIFGYFDHVNSLTVNGLLTSPGTGVNEGLNTAWALHGSTYMNTGADGFGSVYNIESGLENYALDRGYKVKVVVHASPTYDPNSSDSDWLNDYGPYGDSWLNDGDFWRTYADGSWDIDASDFCDFVETKITSGITIFLTIDTNLDGGGDHWVALVGFDRSNMKYAFYDTYSTTVHWADIHYCGASGTKKDNAISFIRSVAYEGSTTPDLNPPTDLVALKRYHGRVPLAWNQPASTRLAISSNRQVNEIHPPKPENILFKREEIIPRHFSILETLLNMPEYETNSKSIATITGLSGYNVYRSTTSGGTYVKIASKISRQYYNDESASNGKKYYYKVSAVYNNGESGFSNIDNATPQTDGYTVEAGWSDKPPVIDGLIKLDEWADAKKTNIVYPGYSEQVILYVMNDKNYLYLAVDDVRDNSLDNLDQFAFIFDENFDQEWPAAAPSGEGFIWTAWDGASSSAFSAYGGRNGYWPFNLGIETNVIDPSGVVPGVSKSSGHVQYETRIDMSSSPFNTTTEYKVGFLVFIYDYTPMYFNAFWPQEAERLKAITPSVHSWGTAPFSFGVLVTAGEEEVTEPDIAVTPLVWDYGSVNVGSHADKIFTVENKGNATLNVSNVTITGDLTQYSIESGGGSYSLAPGSSRQILVRFAPTSAGIKSVSVNVVSNDPDESPLQVDLTGTGVVVENPSLAVTPTMLNFGTEETNKTFQISNSGSGNLTWSIAENPDKSWITTVSPASGTNNATISVTVDRNLLVGEHDTGTLAITSNGGNKNVSVSIEKTVLVLPDHWQFNDNTGNLATIVLPTSANPNINGEPLMDGDYIGVFTPAGMCCGWKQWHGENISITAWGDDAQTTNVVDGFRAGERIYYQVLRLNANIEWNTVSVGYSTGDGLYAPNAYMVIDKFDVSEGTCMTIAFNNGWNMFSINVEPDDPDIGHCMATIVNQIVLVKSGSGQSFIPQYNINDIGNMQFDKGYQAYLKQSVSIEFCGALVASNTPIPLAFGWSMISYLPRIALDADVALAGIVDKLVLVKNNMGQTFIPLYNINDIGQMVPGQGYQLYMDEAGTLVYPAGTLSKRAERNDLVLHSTPPEHFLFKSNTGENATVVVTADNPPKYADGSPLQNGDEIGILNSEGMCCGAAVWEGTNVAITVWGDDKQTEDLDGFVVGDTLKYCVWSKAENFEYMASAIYQDGSPQVYQVNGFSIINQLTTLIETGIADNNEKIPDHLQLMQNYPNPFNPTTIIAFDLPRSCFVELSIYNIAGQLIETLVAGNMGAGHHKVKWDAGTHPNGVYLYKLQTGDFKSMKKMVLTR